MIILIFYGVNNLDQNIIYIYVEIKTYNFLYIRTKTQNEENYWLIFFIYLLRSILKIK